MEYIGLLSSNRCQYDLECYLSYLLNLNLYQMETKHL